MKTERDLTTPALLEPDWFDSYNSAAVSSFGSLKFVQRGPDELGGYRGPDYAGECGPVGLSIAVNR